MADKPLTTQAIHHAIHEVCTKVTENQGIFSFRRAQESEFTSHSSAHVSALLEDTTPTDVDTSLLFGFMTSLTNNNNPHSSTFLTTFCLAYSAYDGRVLYLDQRGVPERHDNNVRNTLAQMIRLVLGKIAVQLDCNRFVWYHYDKLEYAGTIQPKTLQEVLTLHLDADRIKAFAGEFPKSAGSLSVREAMEQSLEFQGRGNFRLRLASVNDLETICRMVQGLADYERQPDAVNVSEDQFRLDGFGEQPLFYCVLLDCINDENEACSCGMAFCFFGYTLRQGRFLYLEALFVEEPYRGKGAGSLIMRTLALAAQFLGCVRLVWQALDWNEKGLAFYQKIGAKVLDSPCLRTSRFAREALKEYAYLNESEVMQSI